MHENNLSCVRYSDEEKNMVRKAMETIENQLSPGKIFNS